MSLPTLVYSSQLFIVANVEMLDKQSHEAEVNPDRALLRFELVEVLVRVALAKYFDSGQTDDPSEALELLCETNLTRGLAHARAHGGGGGRAGGWDDANAFRRAYLYTESFCGVVDAREEELRELFEGAVDHNKVHHRTYHDVKGWPAMSLAEWLALCKRCGLLDARFKEREARAVFARSKMRVADELMTRGTWITLRYTDFIEARLPRP